MSLKTYNTCTDCGLVSCNKEDKEYPDFCLTTSLDKEELKQVIDLYSNDEETHKIAIASAQVEGAFYGKYTRVEEIMEFARQINAKKIGIATCVGLISESRIFAKILKKNGFEVYGVGCKVGTVDKSEIGIDPEYIMKKGEHICNPIMQAKILNKNETDLNVVVGLCVGHDSLFYKHAIGITTTLITKDRVTGHNPVAAIYTAQSYYNKLL